MSPAVGAILAAERQQLPEDIGKAGPLGLLLIVLLLIAVAVLVKSMAGHLKRVPRSFDPHDAVPEVPDTPAELLEPAPGAELLDTLRRRPLAIEPPRNDDSRPEGPAAQG
jgi:hypothetical protein